MKVGAIVSRVYVVVMIVFVLTPIVLWEHYKYAECKKVGHSTFYCVVQGGK